MICFGWKFIQYSNVYHICKRKWYIFRHLRQTISKKRCTRPKIYHNNVLHEIVLNRQRRGSFFTLFPNIIRRHFYFVYLQKFIKSTRGHHSFKRKPNKRENKQRHFLLGFIIRATFLHQKRNWSSKKPLFTSLWCKPHTRFLFKVNYVNPIYSK
jgi:hypothetical protein